MEENKNLVTEEVAENTEITAEEIPIYTETQFNEKVKATVEESIGKKIARREAKIRREYEKKYSSLEDVLRAGTGKESVEEITDTFRDFYRNKGVNIPKKVTEYSARDIEVLAKAEAEEIIRSGDDEVTEEVDRLAELGASNMTAKEKAVFQMLAEYRQNTERNSELSKIGVSEDVYNSKEFKDFAAKFISNTPITDIYNIYSKTQPKKEIKPMGSMKGNTADESKVKDFYTYEEAVKFSNADFDKNPALYDAIVASMAKWK